MGHLVLAIGSTTSKSVSELSQTGENTGTSKSFTALSGRFEGDKIKRHGHFPHLRYEFPFTPGLKQYIIDSGNTTFPCRGCTNDAVVPR